MNIRLHTFVHVAFALEAIFAGTGAALAQESAKASNANLEFFEKKIRPILVSQCYACHSADTKPAGGLRVDDFGGLIAGGNTGPAVVAGSPDESLLLERITHKNSKRRMPQDADPLTEEQVSDLRKWIAAGAAWPQEPVEQPASELNGHYAKLREEHWAWQSLQAPAVPTPQDAAWPRDDIDRFILARLESRQLAVNSDASKLELIRRITFDLTGLPPTPEQVATYLADSSEQALEKVVDRLLATTAFGEHWGRHWLDVARYGESTGPSRNIPYPHAWRFRDYVIASLNADVPYDRFIQEQIAGDLLPAETDEERNRLSIATGFLALGVKDVNQRFKVRFEMDNVDEQIDVVSKSILGLTVSCARCHDHKFDPIPTADYYALAGIFTSTVNAAGLRNQMGGSGLAYYVPDNLVKLQIPLPPPPAEEVAELTAKVEKAKAAWDAIRGTPEGLKPLPSGAPTQRKFRNQYEKLQAQLSALTDPAERGAAIHGTRDAAKVGNTYIRIRGEAEKLGRTVPRGFLSAFEVRGANGVNPVQSGRLELAQWLTSRNNPLTARVAVNRIWHHLFGRGIVATVDNFGFNGDTPTHPELLDHLASEFISDGWSVKRLIKRIVLSRTYGLSTEESTNNLAVDPGNTLLWRHSPRRLSAEEVRDAMLAIAGTLEQDLPVGSPAQKLKMVELRDNGPEARAIYLSADQSRHRSVYLPLLRGLTPRALEAFDPVDQTLVTGSRDATTVPSQALFLLNSSFVRLRALELAKRLQANGGGDSLRIKEAYRLVIGREPSSDEEAAAISFLSEFASSNQSLAGYTTRLAAATESAATSDASADTRDDELVLDPDQISQEGDPIDDEIVWSPDDTQSAWLAFTQALLASAEFLYVR